MKNHSPKPRTIAFFLFTTVSIVLFQALALGQSLSSRNLNFGSVAQGDTPSRSVVFTNSGERTLVIKAATARGAAFRLAAPSLPLALTPGASASFTITFTPAAPGSFNGNASITYARHAGRGRPQLARIFLSGVRTGGSVAAVLQSITLSPALASIAVGATAQFTAMGNYSDGSSKSLTSSVTWTSSVPTNATVAAGLAKGVAAGGSSITAALSGITSPAAALAVTAAPAVLLRSITVTPTLASIAVGATQQFTAMGNYSDGSSKSLTSSVTWTSSVSADATVAAGLAKGVAAGGSSITAALSGITSPAAALTVTAAPAVLLRSITVSPSSASIAVGATQQFTAMGNYSDGSSKSLTSSVTWASSVAADATVTAGLAKGLAAGGTSITAALSGISSPAAALTVTAAPAAVLQSITVSPTSGSIAVGATRQFTAMGNYSDGSSKSLTSSVTWTSSVPADATVTAAGLAKGVAAGATGITAALSGITSPIAALTVTAAPAAVLQSLTVSPTSASVAVGATQPFTATGHYSDGSTLDLTSLATWAASVPADATITAGLAKGVAAGSTNVTATLSGVTSSPVAVLAVTTGVATGGGNSFYVATTGNDSNSGTLASPWRTLQHAASTVQAGDTVLVRAGVYHESVNIGVSGSAGAGPVTFESYPGETAILDGTGLTPSSSDTQGLFNIVNQSYVTLQGFEIRNYTTSNANAIPAGIWVTGSGSNLQILNNIVHNITTTSEKNGNAFGIAVYGSGAPASIDSLTISGNQVYNLRTGNSESVNVDGNVTNFAITNNIIHDNDNIGIDAIGFESVSSGIYDQARNGEISGNTVYNITAISNPGEGSSLDADGIYCDGCANVVIERNLLYNNDLNIEAASEHSGHVSSFVTIRNNVVYHGNSVGISIGGYASNVGGSDHITIVNNTLFENDTQNTGSGELQVQYYATNCVFKNNIVYASSQGLFINNYTNSEPSGLAADYNLYFSSLNSASADFLWNGTDHTGFSAYQTASGQDSHSQYADPLFLSLTTPNLQVESTSPAVNRGTNLGATIEGTLDFAGNPRAPGSGIDLGAYQQ